MKKRNILFLGLLAITLFIGLGNAKARTIYTSYDSGDKITVNVNNSTKVDFFVVSDSDSSNTKVLALTYDFVNNNKYNYSGAQTLLGTTKTAWNNAISVNIPTSLQLMGESVDFENPYESTNFTEPTWVSPQTNEFTEYWLSDLPFEGSHSVVWGMDTNRNSQFHISPKEDTEEIYVKFIIEIEKEYVVGGTTTSEIDDLNVSFKYNSDAKNTYRDVYLDLKSNKFQDSDYRALLSKTNSNIPETYSDDTNLVYMSSNINDSSNYTIDAVNYFKYASMYGDVYLTIYEYDGTNFIKTSTPKLVKRLDYLPYTYRIVAQFFHDKSAQFKVNDIYDMETGEQKIKFKIGEVSDKSLLSKFSNPNNESYEALIKYAQEDKNAIQSSSIKLNEKTLGDSVGEYEGVYDPSKIVDGKYYYVYLEIDTEDGKYYPLTDIGLYISEKNGNLVSSNYKDEVVENPKTGSASGIIGIVAITTLLIGSVAYIKMKKYSKFPQA